VEQAFKAVMVDVILHLGEQSANEIPDEDHFRFQCTQDRQEDGFYCTKFVG
jgi:hypothetical protein